LLQNCYFNLEFHVKLTHLFQGDVLDIFEQTKNWVKTEKIYTAKILKNLMIIEKNKLYADLKYSSLHKYIIKELNYSDAEATVRTNAVRLMLKSKKAQTNLESGKLSLTNACEANKVLGFSKDPGQIERIVDQASNHSTREFKKICSEQNGAERREVLVLNELMIKDFDRLRKIYGDLSTHELIRILLEKELHAPGPVQSVRPFKIKNSRFIPKSVKKKVYTGRCANCGVKHGLEYDHQLKFSLGGKNDAKNIVMLCRSCNQRKEIKARQTGFFA